MSERIPSAADAIEIVERAFGVAVAAIDRFPSGLAHYVYDVGMADGRRFVARLGRRSQTTDFVGALLWNRRLRELGVPLPEVLGADVAPADDGFPFLLLERLPGIELREAYPTLSDGEKRALALRMAALQAIVGTLPTGSGFGYAATQDDPHLHRSWIDVLLASLARSRRCIAEAGLVSTVTVDRVAERVTAHRACLDAVTPRAFLDDATTKNVLVHEGRLSGIVDVDWVCYGDPLFAVALTRASLRNLGYDEIYSDAWFAAMGYGDERRAIFALYAALFCVDFLGELGHRFNQEAAAPVRAEQLDRLSRLVDELLTAAGE